MISCPKSLNPIESSSTITPSPPTVDHLPNSGVANKILPMLLQLVKAFAALTAGHE